MASIGGNLGGRVVAGSLSPQDGRHRLEFVRQLQRASPALAAGTVMGVIGLLYFGPVP